MLSGLGWQSSWTGILPLLRVLEMVTLLEDIGQAESNVGSIDWAAAKRGRTAEPRTRKRLVKAKVEAEADETETEEEYVEETEMEGDDAKEAMM